MKSVFLMAFTVFVSAAAQAQSVGSLLVQGEASRFQIFQKVKVVRCDTATRSACDAPVFLDLNKPISLPVGQYIVGYENSIHPGLVSIQAGAATRLRLERLQVPSSMVGQKVKVYRDLSQEVEQNKILTSMFYLKRHFFRVNKDTFGDLYLTGSWDRDFIQRFTYEACGNIASWARAEDRAKVVCAAYNNATQPSGLKEMYTFGSDGTMTELWVTYPGDVFASKHPRYMVATPLKDAEFISVFAGAYKFESMETEGLAVSIRVGSY